MKSYDMSQLPPPVHDAVLHVLETLVQAFPPSAEVQLDQRPRAGSAPIPMGEDARPLALALAPTLPVPTTPRCPHGTPEAPCCATCTTVHTAEAVLVDVQDATPPFPRSVGEFQVLEALHALAPMPATPRQISVMINRPHLEVRTMLQALAMLETIDHPGKGYYAHRASRAEVRPSTRFAAQISALCAPHTTE